MKSSHFCARWSAAASLALASLTLAMVPTMVASPACAQVPVPSPTFSTCPTVASVAGDGSCCFPVVVRDQFNNPISGSHVTVDFGTCVPKFCPQQAPGVTITGNTASAVTSVSGLANLCICVCLSSTCTVRIYADGVLLCVVDTQNCKSCDSTVWCDTCATAVTADSMRAGRWDDFDQSDGPEFTSPGSSLAALCPGGRTFDNLSCNSCFAHTITFPVTPDCAIIGATLRLHLRACTNTGNDDIIGFYRNGSSLWTHALTTLAPGGHWNNSDSMTIVLDLCRLPGAVQGAPTTSITSFLISGTLDVMITDDTGVDYMELTLYRCCHEQLHGTKYDDLNHNGVRDAGEPGLANWTIDLAGPVSGSTTTGYGGAYSFAGLPAGSYTVSETNQSNWVNTGGPAYNVNLSGGTLTGLDFGNAWCDTAGTSCTSPPRCIVSWYTFDDAIGNPPTDKVSGYTGSNVGVTGLIAGVHGFARSFPGGANYLVVPGATSPGLDFGTGSFSIDAWIRTTAGSTGSLTVQAIVDKRIPPSGGVGSPTGYTLYLAHAVLGVQVATAAGYVNYGAGPALNDGAWHFVAATVCRPPGGSGTVRLYVDGAQVGVLASGVPTGSVTSGADLWVAQPKLDFTGGYVGDLDELQLMGCCVDSLTLARVYHSGKPCVFADRCYISRGDVLTYAAANPYLVICNNTSAPQTYHWSVASLSAGPGCTVGGLVFTPNSGTASVAPHGCTSILLNGNVSSVPEGGTSCFDATVMNDSTGECCHCSGKVSQPSRWTGRPSPLKGATTGNPVDDHFYVRNLDVVPHQLNWALRDVASDDDSANVVAALNGLPPGTPTTGSVYVAAGDSALVEFTAVMTEFQPYTIHEILLSAATDGDGVFQDVCGLPLLTVAPGSGTVAVSAEPPRAFTRVSAGPNPFQRLTWVSFSLPQAELVTVDVYDVLGRRVRRLQSGLLAAGDHRLAWDGRDAFGVAPGGGVYFVRVMAGARQLTTKVVQMR